VLSLALKLARIAAELPLERIDPRPQAPQFFA
jgi:hypothetical protein